MVGKCVGGFNRRTEEVAEVGWRKAEGGRRKRSAVRNQGRKEAKARKILQEDGRGSRGRMAEAEEVRGQRSGQEKEVRGQRSGVSVRF